MPSLEIGALSASDAAMMAGTLALNNAHAAATSWLDPAALRHLVDQAFCARVIGLPGTAFVLALDETASYDSANFAWFHERYVRFVYVDRIVVAASAAGQGVASRLYEAVIAAARAAGHDHIVCEINLDPPNLASEAFHAARGFVEVGRAVLPGSGKLVKYVEKPIAGWDQPIQTNAQHAVLRSYGRRKGHTLSDRRERLVDSLLPKLALDLATPCPSSPTQLFTSVTKSVWLEIGFGGAEHLLWQAANHPGTGLIGCEPFINGVAKALAGIDDQRLDTIRLHAGDARDVLAWLPPESIARAFVLFPDPWPKKRQRKRRIVSVDTLCPGHARRRCQRRQLCLGCAPSL
jgi:predicted GNAT superfamily acetyltransferase